MENNKGFVYLLCDGFNEGIYKIGVTRGTIERRIKKLQTGNPGEIHICRYYHTKIPFFIEKHLHLKFFSKKVMNEWFELDPNDVFSFEESCKQIEDMYNSLEENCFFKKSKCK